MSETLSVLSLISLREAADILTSLGVAAERLSGGTRAARTPITGEIDRASARQHG